MTSDPPAWRGKIHDVEVDQETAVKQSEGYSVGPSSAAKLPSNAIEQSSDTST
ncbi:hypothetical protein DOTSEDRAFT_67482 [Dothistroma septosporum NZE10]|uniref:Uncharacterized protein n=1 Tax=Dothistroma septosporum (strain NZE10 / CBS 128990) TaxID=675120 RepID=N1PYE3_DOTSN|nr:hypothetical protein DOTSEDRAFT_67482 [Dothistroma septosporum NZE10]